MQSFENRKGERKCKQQNVLSYYDEENSRSENPERRGARSARELKLLTNRNGTCRMIQNLNENQSIRSNHQSGSAMHTTIISKIKNVSGMIVGS